MFGPKLETFEDIRLHIMQEMWKNFRRLSSDDTMTWEKFFTPKRMAVVNNFAEQQLRFQREAEYLLKSVEILKGGKIKI